MAYKRGVLTPKQKIFVEEYLVDFNASRAARSAGYSLKTADVTGRENLRKPLIQAALSAETEKRSKRTHITQDRVLLEYARIAFADVRKFYNEDGSLKSVVDLDDDSAACVAGIEDSKFKLNDKMKGLDGVAKHIGFFEADNKQKNGDKLVIAESMTEEEMRGLLKHVAG